MMLTEKQLAKLKKQLIEQKSELIGDVNENENELLARASLRDSTDELSTVDNHPADLATELYDREKDMALKVHSDDLLVQVNAAFERMEHGTYGVCATCHAEIPYDRLRAIPYTTFCIDHSEAKSVPTDRPIEEELLHPAVDNSFSGREDHDELQDNEDSFQIVAQYGNSDTPADFEGDYDHYNDLYKDKDGEEMYSALEFLHLSKEDQLNGQISQKYADEASKYDYLD
ncbi:TraR/DksA C4-type zinc finger protein [Solibacillus sp. FSL W8-0372]|uniref:TraR/DksA C4-type zinc finger protein n=1 Tax=Solibacillus sp. FSL W8-0372 TaxID=2921713 RepID=UPI0030CD3981